MKCKVLSLWQPWGWLCVAVDEQGRAEKEYETRSWQTDYRGPLVIHAAKKWDGANATALLVPEFKAALRRHFTASTTIRDALGFGAAIGMVDLVACIPTRQIRAQLSAKEQAFGNFADGRFAWQFANPRKFEKPIPLRGQQGLWEVDLDV